MDWTQVGVDAITALTSVVTMVALWGLKSAWNKIPASWLFIAAPLAGIVFNYGITYLTGHAADFGAIGAALAGLGAIVLREFLTTLQTKGLLGSVSRTNRML